VPEQRERLINHVLFNLSAVLGTLQKFLEAKTKEADASTKAIQRMNAKGVN
jgi:hypothetical protein